MFRIGQKVVCVYDAIQKEYKGEKSYKLLVKGEIYTIEDIKSCPCGRTGVSVGINLPEELGGCGCSKCDFDFSVTKAYHIPHYFRPIDEAFGENVAAQIESDMAEYAKLVG